MTKIALHTSNPAVMHHTAHVVRHLIEMARLQTLSASINPIYRDVHAPMRDVYMAAAQAGYWTHCWRLSQLENGTYT